MDTINACGDAHLKLCKQNILQGNFANPIAERTDYKSQKRFFKMITAFFFDLQCPTTNTNVQEQRLTMAMSLSSMPIQTITTIAIIN